MNQDKLREKVDESMVSQIEKRGFAAPVDVLMDLNILSRQDFSKWRSGSMPYLESVCRANLNKLSVILQEMRRFGYEHRLKESQTVYKKYGKPSGGSSNRPLRFSKSGKPEVEKQYSTHYVKLKIQD